MAIKKVNPQEEMVNEMIEQIQRVSGDGMTAKLAGEIVDEVIKATEKETDASKIVSLIGRIAKFPKDDVRTEEIYAIITLSPLTQTYLPFDDPKLAALKETLSKDEN